MKVELTSYTPYASAVCCDAAAVCTASDNGYRSLQHSLESGHESVLEHEKIRFFLNTGFTERKEKNIFRKDKLFCSFFFPLD